MLVIILILGIITAIAFGGYAVSTRLETTTMHRKLNEVNEAVNHRAHGMPTLVQQITNQDARGTVLAEDLANFREWTQQALECIASAQGVVLPTPPKRIVTPEVKVIPPEKRQEDETDV